MLRCSDVNTNNISQTSGQNVDVEGMQLMNADLVENSAKLDLFLANHGKGMTALEDAEGLLPAPKRRKSLEQQRSSLPPMHITTDGRRPMPLLSKSDMAELDLSDFDDSTDDGVLASTNTGKQTPGFAVDLGKNGSDRRRGFRRRGKQNSLPDLQTSKGNMGSTIQVKRSESSSPVDMSHDPLGIFGRLKNLMKRTEKTQQALQEWDKSNGLPKSHSQTMVNSSRSRRQIQEGRIIPKWDGTPLINEEVELGKPKPRGKPIKPTKK